MGEYNMETTYWKDKVVVKIYDEPIKVGRKRTTKKPRRKFEQLNDDEKAASKKRREKYRQGKIRNLKRLAMENDFKLFITLTFRENLDDPAAARHRWRLFVKRLRYNYPDVRFMAVPERQKRGAIHFHALLGGVDYIDHQELQKLWKDYGFVFIEKVKPGSRVVDYLFKYLAKDLGTEPWQKIYCSRNLQKPRVEKSMTADKVEDVIFDHMESVIDSGSYIVTQETGIPINRCEVVTISRNHSR